jgi:hypothetical protein
MISLWPKLTVLSASAASPTTASVPGELPKSAAHDAYTGPTANVDPSPATFFLSQGQPKQPNHATWYARAVFHVVAFLAQGLAFFASQWARVTHRQPAIALTQDHAYPSLPNLYAELGQKGVAQKDARAITAHIVHTDGRFVRDLALHHQVGKKVDLNDPQRRILTRHGKRLTQDLVALKMRSQAQFQTSRGEIYVQRFGHMHALPMGGYERVWDKTLSSDGIKGDTKKRVFSQRGFNANLAAITKSSDATLSVVRSARTDTPERLLELLHFGAGLQASMGPYKAAIVTALDGSPKKDIAARLFGESEVDMLAHQASSVATVFGQGNRIFGHDAQGNPREIVQPVLLRSVMSTQAHSVMNRLQAREANAPAMATLWLELAQALDQSQNAQGGLMGRTMGQATTLSTRVALLQDPAFAAGVATLPGAPRWAINTLRLHMVGSLYNGENLLHAQGVAQEALHLFALLAATGRIPHLQCKSGEDRTLSLVGLWLSAEANAWFTHAQPRTDAQAVLGPAFMQATTQFGVGPIRDVRGVGGAVKWGLDKKGLAKHPVPRSLFPARMAPNQTFIKAGSKPATAKMSTVFGFGVMLRKVLPIRHLKR